MLEWLKNIWCPILCNNQHKHQNFLFVATPLRGHRISGFNFCRFTVLWEVAPFFDPNSWDDRKKRFICDNFTTYSGGSRISRGGGANNWIYLSRFLPKTAWKWKKLDKGDARDAPRISNDINYHVNQTMMVKIRLQANRECSWFRKFIVENEAHSKTCNRRTFHCTANPRHRRTPHCTVKLVIGGHPTAQ